MQRWGLLRMAIPRNIGVTCIIALVNALAKLHNFCIGESNVLERLPRMYDKDRLHIMNADSGYIGLGNDNPQQNTLVPTTLMHAGEHFDDIARNDLRSRQWQSAGNELPQTQLSNFIADRHWQWPTSVCNRCR